MTHDVTHNDVKRYYNDTYYKDLKEGRPRWHYKIYLNLLKINKSHSGKRILDIGCGNGNLLSHAHSYGLKSSGIDISDKAIAFAKEKYSEFDLRCGIAEDLPWPSEYFDFITCLGSFEHFLDQAKALSEMLRVAKADAKFLIMVPNKNYPDFTGTDQQQIKETLLSLTEWKQILEKRGS